jgi:hypothetical protein
MRYMVLIAGALLLTACGGGRAEEQASFWDPPCMPDGSVVYYQYPNKSGAYDAAQGSRANCTWNKAKMR